MTTTIDPKHKAVVHAANDPSASLSPCGDVQVPHRDVSMSQARRMRAERRALGFAIDTKSRAVSTAIHDVSARSPRSACAGMPWYTRRRRRYSPLPLRERGGGEGCHLHRGGSAIHHPLAG